MTAPLFARATARRQPPARPLRLFVALWPDASTQARLHAESARFASYGRRLPARNLHVTLAFLGSVVPARVDEVVQVIEAARPQACEVVLDKLAYFARSRVLAAAPSEVPVKLAACHGRLSMGLAALGRRVERHAFHPHITLLRDAMKPAAEHLVPAQPVAIAVREIVLVRSEPAPGGSRYEVIKRVPAPA